MKPHVPFLSFAVAALAALTLATTGCQQLANALGGGGGGAVSDAGTLGSVCEGPGSGADGVECCTATGDGCTYDYECCAGLCNSDTTGDTFCDLSQNGDTATAELGSRCTSVAACACETSDDCFQGACGLSVVTSAGKRCCLETGTPCGFDGDCCTDQCDPTTSACD